MAPSITDSVVDSQANSYAKSKAKLETDIRARDLVPLWNTGGPPTNPEPGTKFIPAIWKYEHTKKLLIEAGEVVDAKEAERRALLMINPGPKLSPHTLDTLLVAHQLILPGEKALCHRHTPFAVRFLIEGEQGYTAISGKKMYMQPGDLIITPSFQWHDHGNEGSRNVIWMDGLNIPFFKLCPIDFTEVYQKELGKELHDSKVVSDEEASDMKFPWRETQRHLDASAGDQSIFHYTLPSGLPISTIISASAEKIAAGTSTAVRQDTANRIYQVHSGSGKVVATSPKGDSYELSWGINDAFVVPSWYGFIIYANDEKPVYLFTFSDKAMQDNLSLYRSKY